MTYQAQVIKDSISHDGFRLTTIMARYPRFIHAEMMTHRALSKNSSSSRAIPIGRLIEDIKRDTAMPLHWGKAQKGMQAFEECNEIVRIGDGPHPEPEELDFGSYYFSRENAWLFARDQAIMVAQALAEAGYHKQIVNRLLEPFVHMNVLISGTEWKNFFALRCHPDAQPEIQAIACAIRDARNASTPNLLLHGEWHLPYISEEEREIYCEQVLIKLSVARCARVSYLTTEGKKPTYEQDIALYERLVGSEPIHASPAEHVATPDTWMNKWSSPDLHGNFVGWKQHRKLIPGNTQ